MKVHRFSLPQIPSTDQLVVTDLRFIHQVNDVLELRQGEKMKVFDQVVERMATIVIIKRGEIVLELGPVVELPLQLPFDLTLAVSLLKGDAWDDMIREVSQLGVTSVIPLVCERTIVRQLNERKLERYKIIAREATELSGGMKIPEIKPIQNFQAWITQVNSSSTFLLDESGEKIFQFKLPQSLTVLVGPEGGWTPAELKQAINYKVQILSLLPRVITARLAPTVAASAILSQ